ncbi:RNA-directed DNA polymerase, eukaryota [Tanacetum coccineum]
MSQENTSIVDLEDSFMRGNAQSWVNRLFALDKLIDQGRCNEDLVSERSDLLKELHDLNLNASLDMIQKLSDIERDVTYDEIKNAIWDCRTNKSPGPDGFTFEFFRRYWKTIDDDVVAAVLQFFSPVKWLGGIQGCLHSAMGSILVNGSLTSGFKFFKGLKQGDPLSHFLFILIMESLHLSFKNVVNAGLYKGIPIDDSLILSHLFYVDDVVFVGKWDKMNVTTIVNVLKCFFLASGLKINLQKSKLMGIGFPHEDVLSAAESIGCFIFTMPFNFLRVKVGDSMSRRSSWEETIDKLSSRLSKWKLKALSIGGRLTLIKFVLSSVPLYHMSIFKCPMGVLKILKSIRRNLFNGVANSDRNLSLIGWKNILASKKNGGLGVLSFFALNCALLFKWGVSSPMTLPYGLVMVKYSFRIAPRGGIEEDQFRLLRASVAHILLPQINDRWV